jgi:hypothetical protein
MDKTKTDNSSWTTVDGHGVVAPCPELMTEEELIVFLRIPLISKAHNYNNVIEHLKRYRDLPRIRICNKVLYPTQAIQQWIERETTNGN